MVTRSEKTSRTAAPKEARRAAARPRAGDTRSTRANTGNAPQTAEGSGLVGRELWIWRQRNGYQLSGPRERRTIHDLLGLTDCLINDAWPGKAEKEWRLRWAEKQPKEVVVFTLNEEGKRIAVRCPLVAEEETTASLVARFLLTACVELLEDDGHKVEAPIDGRADGLAPKLTELVQQARSERKRLEDDIDTAAKPWNRSSTPPVIWAMTVLMDAVTGSSSTCLAAAREVMAHARKIQDTDDRLVRSVLRAGLTALRVGKDRVDNLLRGPVEAKKRLKKAHHFVDFMIECCTSLYDEHANRHRATLPRLWDAYERRCDTTNRKTTARLTYREFSDEVNTCGGLLPYHPTADGKRPVGFRGIALLKIK